MKELTLIIDTSIHGAAVGIHMANGRDLVFSEVSEGVADSASQLPHMVERGLRNLSVAWTDVTSVVVSQGPGSFTGIRVGLAYAYGLSFGLRGVSEAPARVFGVSTLKTMAEWLARQESTDIVLCLPATRSSGYLAVTRGGVATLAPLDLTVVGATNGWPDRWVLIGDWELLVNTANALKGVVLTKLNAKEAAHDSLLAIAALLSRNGGLTWSGSLPDAIYLRKSTVEEKSGLQ